MSSDLRGQAVTARPGGASPAQDPEQAVLALFDATSSAWRDGDAGAFAGRYAEDATVILPGVHLRGRAGIRASMGDAFAGPLKGSRRIHTPRGVRFLGADVAVVVTRSATVFPGEAEPPADRWELATWTLARRDGRWLVETYHSCPAG
ncbi:SgcJ/EcaC family oxidoreductase [Microbispora sp. NPDC049125]|uniref:SgcJ/EcaC family oxidoreductase n=1 Tax=Microbispora sp. NPDC049125 TaxID=3154929 RepID=UPI003466D8EF